MSFREALEDLASAAVEEFGDTVWHVPTIRPPNGRPIPDPNRAPYTLCAIFDKAQGGTTPYDATLNPKGRGEPATVSMVQPVLSMRACELRYPVAEADEFIVPREGTFRVIDVHRDTAGVARCRLEQVGRHTPA